MLMHSIVSTITVVLRMIFSLIIFIEQCFNAPNFEVLFSYYVETKCCFMVRTVLMDCPWVWVWLIIIAQLYPPSFSLKYFLLFYHLIM